MTKNNFVFLGVMTKNNSLNNVYVEGSSIMLLFGWVSGLPLPKLVEERFEPPRLSPPSFFEQKNGLPLPKLVVGIFEPPRLSSAFSIINFAETGPA